MQTVGWWALLSAAIGATLALIAGLFDMYREKIDHAAHKRVHIHMKVRQTRLLVETFIHDLKEGRLND